MLQNLTQADIDKFYEDFEDMKLLKPNAVMRKASGLSSGNVSEYLNKLKTPSLHFINSFYEKVYKSSINVPRETTELTVAQEEQGLYVSHKKTQAIDKDQIIADLAHTNRGLADELKEIKNRLKQLEQKQTTADVALYKRLAESPIVDVILAAIGEVGAGKRWHSKEEGKAALQIRIHQNLIKEKD